MTGLTATFLGVTLPDLNAQVSFGSGSALSGIVPTLGGHYDSYGSTRRPVKFPVPLTLRGVVVRDASYQATLDSYRGMVGQYGQFYATMEDATQRWCWATLLQVDDNVSPENINHRELAFTFERQSVWHGTAHAGDVPLQYVMPGPSGQTPWANLYNYGQLPVRDVILALTVGAELTSVKFTWWRATAVERTGHEWEYVGTVAAGKTLTIDTSLWQVLNDGADDFGNFHRTSNHTQEELLELDPAGLMLLLEFTVVGGGSMTLDVTFDELWI